ncbi:MAG: hypothetical protein ACFUZC_11445 [Chthoniobacteraceae bacterium]
MRAFAAVTAVSLLFQGCNPLKKPQPSAEQIQAAVSRQVPAFLEVKEVKPELLPADTPGQWIINVKVSVVPKENLVLLPSDEADFSECNAIAGRLNVITNWHNAYLRSNPSPDVPMVQLGEMSTPDILVLGSKKGEATDVYGKFLAQKQVDRWNITPVLFELPALGQPLSGFKGGNYAVKGTPGGDALMAKFRKVAETNEARKAEFLAKVDAAKKERAEKEQALKKAAKDALVSACQPGVRYAGTFTFYKLTTKVVINFERNEMNGSIIEFKVASAANPNEWVRYTGRMEADAAGKYYVTGQVTAVLGTDPKNNGRTEWRNILNYQKIKNLRSLKIDNGHLEMNASLGKAQADLIR